MASRTTAAAQTESPSDASPLAHAAVDGVDGKKPWRAAAPPGLKLLRTTQWLAPEAPKPVWARTYWSSKASISALARGPVSLFDMM